jgi:tyrosyl-tRNA synthetase
VLSRRGDRRERETYQEQAFKVLDPERTEVRRNGEWLDMPMEELFPLARTFDGRAAARARRLRQALRRSEPISSSSCSTR